MNKSDKSFFKINNKRKIINIILFCILAIVLLFSIYKFFYKNTSSNSIKDMEMDKNEMRLSLLLSEIEGVGSADVMILEDKDEVKSVVVVCDGADDILVNMNVREAVSAALGVNSKQIKIYLKKD